MAKIYKSATELIGHTPLLELANFEAKKGITDTKLIAKLEYSIRRALSRTESQQE